MAEHRVRVAKDKAAIAKAMRVGEGSTGPFQSYADLVVFSAALGAKRKRRVPFKEGAKDIEPIRPDIFDSKGYEKVINLLAVNATKDPNILSGENDFNEERIRIFEEYANGGLEILEEALKGAVDYPEQILLFLFSFKQKVNVSTRENFDLSAFL